MLKALAYFHVFQYPLSVEEIRQSMSLSVEDSILQSALDDLSDNNLVFRQGGFYSLSPDPALSQKRLAGNARADTLLPRAASIGRFLYKFPFVRGIGISGSLSKHYADEKADIDFFIITSRNRLWIARTLLHAYKKLTYLTGRQHLHCMNYFIDEEALLIGQQNIYTAMEVVTLLPVAGGEVLQTFAMENEWAKDWLPAFPVALPTIDDKRPNFFKKIIEKFFAGPRGDRLDDRLLRTTAQRWQRKEKKGNKNIKGKIMHMDTGKHFARSNPGRFLEKVLARYEENCRELLG